MKFQQVSSANTYDLLCIFDAYLELWFCVKGLTSLQHQTAAGFPG